MKKNKRNPEKSKSFSLRGIPKRIRNQDAQKKQGNRKTKKARKSKKARIGAFGGSGYPGFFCGKFAEILRKVRGNLQKKYVLLRQDPKGCGKVAEISREFAENCLQ